MARDCGCKIVGKCGHESIPKRRPTPEAAIAGEVARLQAENAKLREGNEALELVLKTAIGERDRRWAENDKLREALEKVAAVPCARVGLGCLDTPGEWPGPCLSCTARAALASAETTGGIDGYAPIAASVAHESALVSARSEARREALEEACKAACIKCRHATLYAPAARVGGAEWWHDPVGMGRTEGPCVASPIRSLMDSKEGATT